MCWCCIPTGKWLQIQRLCRLGLLLHNHAVDQPTSGLNNSAYLPQFWFHRPRLLCFTSFVPSRPRDLPTPACLIYPAHQRQPEQPRGGTCRCHTPTTWGWFLHVFLPPIHCESLDICQGFTMPSGIKSRVSPQPWGYTNPYWLECIRIRITRRETCISGCSACSASVRVQNAGCRNATWFSSKIGYLSTEPSILGNLNIMIAKKLGPCRSQHHPNCRQRELPVVMTKCPWRFSQSVCMCAFRYQAGNRGRTNNYCHSTLQDLVRSLHSIQRKGDTIV